MKRAIAVAMALVSLVAGACGSGNTDAPRIRSDSPITTTNPPPLDGTQIEFVQEFWHSGFHVQLDKAEVWTSKTIMTNRVSHWLTLWGDFENQGGEIATFDPAMAIVAAGTSYANRSGDPPRILPQSAALGKLTFLIPEDLDLESAVLVVGTADEHQARVPLGSNGLAEPLEPTDIAVSGDVTTEFVDLHFTGASLSYDVPNTYSQLEAGKRALTLHFDVTSRSSRKGQISAEDIALVLPDGSTLAPEVAELAALPAAEDGVTTADQSVSFVVDETLAGDLMFRVTLRGPLVAADGFFEPIFHFTV